ncbi:hypothetical protein HMPREF3156_02763 [Neisseria sp. HMSC06F02]|nr:hypothetical protein HMPREF3156_02763 [Neisseria sp. HMSC06F02]
MFYPLREHSRKNLFENLLVITLFTTNAYQATIVNISYFIIF